MNFEDALQAAVEAGEPIGWAVVDPEGNVVSSGTVSMAQVTSQSLDILGGDSNG